MSRKGNGFDRLNLTEFSSARGEINTFALRFSVIILNDFPV